MIKRKRHPLQRVFSAKAETPHLNLELRFLKSVSLGDQKAETPPAEGVLQEGRDTSYPKLELMFLKSV